MKLSLYFFIFVHYTINQKYFFLVGGYTMDML